MSKASPQCHLCKHVGNLPYSAHRFCQAGIDGTVRATGDELGIRKGWFDWPHNFDPVWLEECNGFDAKHAKIGAP